jgi:hypothetical protein
LEQAELASEALVVQARKSIRGLGFVTFAAGGMAFASDWLFYHHNLGWSAGLFTFGLLGMLLARPVRRSSRHIRRGLALVGFGLVIALAIEPTALAICMTAMVVVSLAILSRAGASASVGQWLTRWAQFLVLGWLAPLLDAIASVKWIRRHPAAGLGGPAAGVRTVSRWIVPALLGGGFVLLFAMANPIVQDWLTRAFEWTWGNLARIDQFLELDRIALWIMTALVVWSLLRFRRGKLRQSKTTRPSLSPLPPPLPWQFTPTARTIIPVSRHAFIERCLVVFNLVFAVESALDVIYLWGGRHLPAGMTFKEYAHRGSYPLIATALLAAAFVLITFRSECNTPAWRTARKLVYFWIVQNVLLSISAGWRLVLLVNASNLTRWRLATAIWLGLVAIGLLSIIWRISTRRDNAVLLLFNIVATVLGLYACCFLNLDGFIANYNAAHCMEIARRGDALGLTYLRDLGIEAIPALDRLSKTLDTPDRRSMARNFANELRQEVANDLCDWRGWTFRRWSLRPGPEFKPVIKAPNARPPRWRSADAYVRR